MEKQKLEEQKADLINDLIAVSTVMDELWCYHPDNPKKKDVVKEFNTLRNIQKDIEKEIADLDV
jgi:hypothetical protein